MISGFQESFHDFDPLNDARSSLTGSFLQFFLERRGLLFEVDLFQKFLDRFRTHAGTETVAVFVACIAVFFLGEHLLHRKTGVTRIEYDIACEIQHLFQHSRRNVEHQADSRGNPLEIPDMGDRRRQFNVTHAFASDAGFRDLNAAAVADDSFIADLLIFTAVAFPVLARAENALAEQSAFFRLQRSVVNGLRFSDLTA